jgi:hypothetical protein
MTTYDLQLTTYDLVKSRHLKITSVRDKKSPETRSLGGLCIISTDLRPKSRRGSLGVRFGQDTMAARFAMILWLVRNREFSP